MSIVRRRRKHGYTPSLTKDPEMEKEIGSLKELIESLQLKVTDLEKELTKKPKVKCCCMEKVTVSKMKDGMGLIWSEKEKSFTPQVVFE